MWTLNFLTVVLVILQVEGVASNRANCDARNYRNVENAPEDLLIYGITQDCQMFFIRPSQLHLLSSIRVDRRHSFCYANLVQLHVKSHDTLLLTFKQANNRICTLEVHIPALSMLFGDHLFRYSLLNSLPYASCSHSKDQTFQLEPDLSFMDPVYNDVLYFIDALSTGKSWRTLQFLLKETGNMNMMNNLTVQIQNKDSSANEYIVSLDNQRDKLYRRNRFDNLIHQQCAFEMLFRPKDSEVTTFETPSRGYGAIVNGQSVDGDLMVYVETDRSTDPPTSRLNILPTSHPEHVECLSATSFSFDIGIIRESTVQKLKAEPRPPFGTKVTPPPLSSKSAKLNEKLKPATTVLPRSTTSTTTSPPTVVPTSTVSSTSSRPKGAYSPSKSFFSYEMGTATSTSSSVNKEEVMSNEIPKDPEEEEDSEEEELKEMIKDLKPDEPNIGVGELKTREISTTSGITPENEETAQNSTSDAEAVKSSRPSLAPLTLILLIISKKLFTY